MVTRSGYQLVVALCLVISSFAQSNNAQREPQAIEANVAFLQQQGLSLGESQLLADSAATPGAEIPILEDVKDGPWHDGSYYFRYTSADGSQREEGGIPTAPCTLRVTGSYSYLAPNANLIDMQYVADENGYRAFPSGTRPDLYTAPVRVPEPIYPVGYFDGIPCPGDEFNNQGDQITSASTQGRPATANQIRPGFGNSRPDRPPVSPPRPGTGAGSQGRPVNGRPTVGGQGRPSSGTLGRPSIGGQRPTTQGRPSTVGQGRPSSGTLGRPTTGSLGRPTTGSPGRPITGSPGRPTTGSLGRPTTGSLGIPITGSQGRPTTGSLGRPTTGSQGRPSYGGQGRPTPSNQGRPTYGQRPTSRSPVVLNQGGFGQRRTTPQAGFKTPTSFITAAPTNINTQNNFNNGGTTIKEGYSYTEPSRTFNFNQQNNENSVTTDFSVGAQTTPIEPLTQLYDSPNY